jgi:hypothetical protein
MADFDLPVAESAYATLLDARHKPRNLAADLVRPLKTETQNEAGRPHKSLDTEPETDPEIWTRAISRTEEWRNILT